MNSLVTWFFDYTPYEKELIKCVTNVSMFVCFSLCYTVLNIINKVANEIKHGAKYLPSFDIHVHVPLNCNLN